MDVVAIIQIRHGNIYIDSDIHDKYFSGLESVALLNRDGYTYIMPLRSGSSGGLLLKMRNAKGDRVIHSIEYLNELGIPYEDELQVEAKWDAAMSGLCLDIPKVEQ